MPGPKKMAWVRAPMPCEGMIAIDPATVTFNGHPPPTHVDAAVHRDGTVGFDDARRARHSERPRYRADDARRCFALATTTAHEVERASIGHDR